MKASRLSSRILRRLSTGARILEISMAYSVLQLSCRRGPTASEEGIATSVPAPRKGRFRPRIARGWFGLCGLLQIVAAICCIAATPVARAQAPGDDAAIEAFLAVRGWLDRDALPALDQDESRVALDGVAAIAVLLRVDGRVVGRGEDATGDPLMVRRAAGRAITEALGDATIRAVRAELGDRVTARLSLEIELAGPTRPLLGRTIAEAGARIVPGAEGIALLKGDAVFRAFPSRLLANDSADRPDATITALLRAAGLPARELREFGPADRVSLGRFATTRLRQPTPSAAPSAIVRGGRLVERTEITAGYVRSLATQLAARLAGQVLPLTRAAGSVDEDGEADAAKRVDAVTNPARPARWGLLGTYNPTADAYDPAFAGPGDEAFAALALACASRTAALPEPSRIRAAESARHLVDSLLARRPDERTDSGDAMALLVLRTIDDAQPDGMLADLTARVGRVARATLDAIAQPPTGDAPQPIDAATIETASILVAALTATRASADERALAGALVDALLARTATTRGRLADGMLPLALAARSDALPAPAREALQSTLRELADVLETLRLVTPARSSTSATAPDAAAAGSNAAAAGSNAAAAGSSAAAAGSPDFPPDLDGGFALPGARAVRADAQGIRLAAAIALVRRPEKAADVTDVGLRASLRFLAQHVADEPWTDGFRRPEALRGLVRGSLASDDCPPAATAAGLLLSTAALAPRPE
jgi:hypothetical protein